MRQVRISISKSTPVVERPQKRPDDMGTAEVVTLPLRVFRNAGALFATGALTRALRIVVFLALARHLGLASYGLLALVVAYVEIFRIVADFGVDTVLIRHLAASDALGRLVGSAAVLKALLGTAAYGIGIGTALLVGFGFDRLQLLLVGLLGVFLSSASNLFATPFQSRLEARRIAWTGVASTVAYLLLVASGIKSGRGVAYFVAAGVVAELCGAGLALLLLTRSVRWQWGGWGAVRSLTQEAAPVGFTTMIVIVYARLGMLMLDRLQGPVAVGTYAVGLRLVEILLLLAGAIASSMNAAMAPLLARDRLAEVRVHFGTIYRHVVVVAATLALTLMLVGRTLLEAIRPEFAVASSTLAILAWATVFMFANQLTSALLLAAGQGSAILKVAAANLAVNATLVAMLVPRFGAVGAAVALLGTEGLNAFVQSRIVWSRFQVAPRAGLWLRVVAASGGTAWSVFHGFPHVGVLLTTAFLAFAVWRRDVSVVWVRHALGIAPR